jgi:hypothetical protein
LVEDVDQKGGQEEYMDGRIESSERRAATAPGVEEAEGAEKE